MLQDRNELSHEDFANRVGERFTARGADDARLELELTDVDVLGEAPEGHRAPFSLKFRDESQDHVPQQTHEVEHKELGNLQIFLVPLGPDAEGMRYEAVFG